MLLFIPDKISEHNFRAVGSKNPEKSARIKANRLRNKCNEAVRNSGLRHTSHSYIRWTEEVETCPKFFEAYSYIQELYQTNEVFRTDVSQSTEEALRSLKNGREKSGEGFNKENETEDVLDLEEGEKYLLKELAFLAAVPNIYENCEEFVFVYHRSWPVLEKFFEGHYDDIVKPSLGFVIRDW